VVVVVEVEVDVEVLVVDVEVEVEVLADPAKFATMLRFDIGMFRSPEHWVVLLYEPLHVLKVYGVPETFSYVHMPIMWLRGVWEYMPEVGDTHA